MNGTSNPHVTYWTVIVGIIVAAIGIAAWKRMSDADKRKTIFGFAA